MVNRQVRKYVNEICKDSISKMFFLENLFNSEKEDKFEIVKSNLIYSVMIGDLYKNLNGKFINNTLTCYEEKTFAFLNIIDDFEIIIREAMKSSKFQHMLLNSVKEFSELNVFGKIELHKCLNKNQIDHLFKISPTIIDDVETYNKDFELNDYMKFYKNYVNHLKTIAPYGCEISFIDAIKNHFVKLFQYDPELNSKVLNELCEYYFKMNSFLEEKNILRYEFLEYRESNTNIYKFINNSKNIEKMLLFWISVEESKKDNIYSIDGVDFSEDEFKNYNKGKVFIKK